MHHATRIVENPDKFELHQSCLAAAARVVKTEAGQDTAGRDAHPWNFI
jgi:hypothetical protein